MMQKGYMENLERVKNRYKFASVDSTHLRRSAK